MLKENSSSANTTGRSSPIRSIGESELRLQPQNADFDGDILRSGSMLTRMNPDRLFEQYVKASLNPGEEALVRTEVDGTKTVIREEQVNQALLPRGYATDISSEIFAQPTSVNTPRKIQKFIFEPGTIMSKPLDKINVDLFMPYEECLFVVPMEDFVLDGVTIPGGAYEVIGKELSKTKFFFWLTFQEIELCVQVNCFSSKKKVGEFEYRAWMAEGPNSTLESKDPRTRYLKPALTLIEPIFAFLEGLSKRKYLLLSNGVVIQGEHVPPPAAVGDVFKVLKYTTDKAYQKRVYKGGTHARPREHERIAHKRTLRNGEVRLVPQVTVNKGVGGRVIKDYLIIDPEVPDEISTPDSSTR